MLRLEVFGSGRPAVCAEFPVEVIVFESRCTGRRTILVVEDQDAVREVIVAQLEAIGHGVMEAAYGRLALDFIDARSGQIQDLVVDLAMPDFSGLDVIRSARWIRPDWPAVLITGRADADLRESMPAGAMLLLKPFQMQELSAALEAARRTPPSPALHDD